MSGPLRATLVVLTMILGGLAGAVLAFFATYYACVLHSREAVQVGWIFCIVTIPVGACIGGALAGLVTARIVKRNP
jgi:hypothetical protein